MYENIIAKVNNAQYEEAAEMISAVKKDLQSYDDVLAVLEAEICAQLGNREGMFQAIRNGLRYNYANYELFFLLGHYYSDFNPYQAYLCYEQAEFYCKDAQDFTVISNAKQELVSRGVAVPGLSIVILSYNACREMRLCLESLKKHVPDSYQIIIVDNASSDEGEGKGVLAYLKAQENILLVCNEENKGFPAGCNQGIKLAPSDNDILLLNNDTIVFPNSVFWLRMGLYEREDVGATGSISSRVGNYQQIPVVFGTLEEYSQYALSVNLPMDVPYEHRIRLGGFAMMLKRTALGSVGLLDERFFPGNYEDDDLSLRLVLNDYKLLLCRNSFIFHFGGTNFGKNISNYHRLLSVNGEKFQNKWGIDIGYYSEIRKGLVSYITEDSRAELHILEVGCGMGATLRYIQDYFPNAHVYGIELSETVSLYAKHYVPTVMQGNIEMMEFSCYEQGMFDYILFPDVLEHLHNPTAILNKVKAYLKPDGYILISVPNIMHYSVVLELLKGNFSYQDSGILDRTHLRFFTLREILKDLAACGYQVTEVQGTRCDVMLGEDERAMYDAVMKMPHIAPESEFQAYQYLIKAQVK